MMRVPESELEVPVSKEVPVLGEPASVLEEPVLEESESVGGGRA